MRDRWNTRVVFGLTLLLWLCVSSFTTSALAQTKLPHFFSDGMVLQRDAAIQVWGWDSPNTKVTVALGEHTASATSDDKGQWSLSLPAQAAGGPLKLTVKGSKSIDLKDVWMGDVWLCSGQSNMEWPVAASANRDAEIAAGNHPMIRHIKINHRPSATPESDLPTEGWKVCTPETVGGFTAVGYFFARHLRTEVDVPIGLIGSNWGGTRIEPWTPPVGFHGVAGLKSISDKLSDYPEKNAEGAINHQSPLALYNGMIHPMIKMPIRGAIWYQGESNNGEGMLYRDKMEALVTGWRKVWNQPELPFYFVQLAPFNYGGDGERLAKIWEAQTASLGIPQTGMAVIVDIADLKDIHPTNKQDVGKRLALWALAKTYGKDVTYSGPLFNSATAVGSSMVVDFEHSSELSTNDGKPVRELLIAGADRRFFPASGEIVTEAGSAKLKVSSPLVSRPTAVRYGFHQLAEPNLVGKDGLPASPFRTDKWDRAYLPVSAGAYVGQWTVKFQIPDGTNVEHPMSISKNGDNLKIEMVDENGKSRELTIAVETHQLQLKFSTDYQGQSVALTYHLTAEGNKLIGDCEFDLAGQTGEFPIEAVK
ncbi:MAG: sialate O-acetylesterase [Pirellulaceae bacterium]|nr:sialate O-acetylesterase [Pirellulaceae bacterium]